MKNKNAQKLAEEWDIMTDAMQPVIVPDGYKAEYLYEQPVLYDDASLMRLPSNISYLPSYGWGIISVKSEHELNEDELDRYMERITQSGAVCVGRLRLTKQTMSLDTGIEDEWRG